MRERLAGLLGKPLRVYLASTGAGAGAQNELWNVPGCSSFFAGATFPYAPKATARFLGFDPERYCTPEVALDLAMASYMAAFDPKEPGKEAIGIGLTASVASLQAHRGDHRVHLACMTSKAAFAQNLTLVKGVGAAARTADGVLADTAALELLLAAAGLGDTRPYEDATAGARLRFFERPYFDARGGRAAPSLPPGGILFPGAFNPPHDGHFAIAREATGELERRVIFHITANPPHKAPLTIGELLQRSVLLEREDRLFTEGDPLYLDKARRFPGHPFLIGADALVRMLDPRWGVDVPDLLAELRALGTRFHVVGRLVDGVFVSHEDVLAHVPEPYRDLFVPRGGRWDLSSSALRARLG